MQSTIINEKTTNDFFSIENTHFYAPNVGQTILVVYKNRLYFIY